MVVPRIVLLELKASRMALSILFLPLCCFEAAAHFSNRSISLAIFNASCSMTLLSNLSTCFFYPVIKIVLLLEPCLSAKLFISFNECLHQSLVGAANTIDYLPKSFKQTCLRFGFKAEGAAALFEDLLCYIQIIFN